MNSSEPPVPSPQLTFAPEALQVSIDGVTVSLTKTEYRILKFLDSQRGVLCSRRQIIDAVQGEDYPVLERSVDVQMASLRKKLGEIGKRIVTIRGAGFRFE